MTPRQVFWVTVAGLGIGGADAYYQVHTGGPYGIQYFLGMFFAMLTPVGSYFIGLVQPRVAATMQAVPVSGTPPVSDTPVKRPSSDGCIGQMPPKWDPRRPLPNQRSLPPDW